MALGYRVENDELVVLDGRRVCYRGRLDGHPVEKVVAVPGSRDAIALFKYESEEALTHFPNLVRVHPDGEIQWQARPPEREPEAHDSWIDFRWWKRGGLSANSWSGFYCEIDAESGAVRSAEFTK